MSVARREFGITPPGLVPPFMNVSELADGTIRVTVRSAGDPSTGATGPLATIIMTKTEYKNYIAEVNIHVIIPSDDENRAKGRVAVYSMPECIFNYCPTPASCDQVKKCACPRQSASPLDTSA